MIIGFGQCTLLPGSMLRRSEVELSMLGGPGVRAGDPCDDIAFQQCQVHFNIAMNYTSTLTWQNASSLNYLIRQSLNKDADEVLKLCKARTQFYQCLGSSYSNCVNRLYLIGKGQTGSFEPYIYVQLWQHLTFLCNAGFELMVDNQFCIQHTFNQPPSNACINDFNSTIHSPSSICGDVITLMSCMQGVFGGNCGGRIGWWICEDYRLGFADDCPGLRCDIIE